ncbi:MAG: hypothetical protein IPM63_14735 [Acidobacteriota bacterium]|nr:MAG: hypothetical protein IPM63_14735 [Acidobacteriota bacterium]
MNKYERDDRQRLDFQLAKIARRDSPPGWVKLPNVWLEGVVGIGFSRRKTNLLLVVTHDGRYLLDCESGTQIAKDPAPYEGLDDHNLNCEGIGEIADEDVRLASIWGGGLSLCNRYGETASIETPEWSLKHLIFCDTQSDALTEGKQEGCCVLLVDEIRFCGFSYCGNHLAAASFEDVYLWRRDGRSDAD